MNTAPQSLTLTVPHKPPQHTTSATKLISFPGQLEHSNLFKSACSNFQGITHLT